MIIGGGRRIGFDVVKILGLGVDFVLVGGVYSGDYPNGVEGVKRFRGSIKKAMIIIPCDCLINEENLIKDK